MKDLTKEYWTDAYNANDAGWDVGNITTPLKSYIDQLTDKSVKILIPGAGNSHEAEYLWSQGFKNIFICDFSQVPLDNFKMRIPDFPIEQLICKNFFDLGRQFDLVIEQTFFCALNPDLRTQYAVKMHEILYPKGKVVGVMFDFPLTETGPPFGGSMDEYKSLFSEKFKIKALERCHNSIKPREGREVFVNYTRKN